MEEKVSNHPCHRLSIPSAKLFWCRHCMQSFEDPINRWRHSKTCKTIGPSNHDKRLEQEPFALQTYVETKEKEVASQPQLVEGIGGEHVVIIKQEKNEPKSEYSCFICKRPFDSLEDMKEHVKYPCSKQQNSDYPVYIPGSGGTFVENANLDMYPNSSRHQSQSLSPRGIIQRQVVQGEIVEQSADPETGVRTFEVHSQNDDIPLSDILSRLSESGYLVAGDVESPVNQIIVVQQVDEKGQITQSEHILPPHIQIQNTEVSKPEDTVEGEEPAAEAQTDDPSPSEEITYYVTETGELIEPDFVQVKQEPRQDLYYGSYDSQSGMNILTQAAEATIGNLINQEKRKAEEELEEEEENIKRSRTQCKPEEDTPYQRPPHSPRSPRGAGGASWSGATTGTTGMTSTTIIKTEQGCDNGNGEGKQQNLDTINDENRPKSSGRNKKSSKTKKRSKSESKKRCSRPETHDFFKCRICDKTFKTQQQLQKHLQFPCKVFHTRNMCQKILRPKRGGTIITGKNIDVRKSKPVSNFSQSKSKSKSKIFRKPILLLDGLRVLPNLFNERRQKPKTQKKKIVPVYTITPPRIKTIWLPNKPSLIVDNLTEKEQFLFEFGLVSRSHLVSDEIILDQNDLPIIPDINDDRSKNLFAPLSISTDAHCLENSQCVNDLYFLPPVLERMDDSRCLDDEELSEEPPILSPILDIQETTLHTSGSVGSPSEISNSSISHNLKEPKSSISEIKSPSKTKSPNPKRHFTDLFVEAAPSTDLFILNENPNKRDVTRRNSVTENKPMKDILMQKDVISKLADTLKKKLSPQKNVNSAEIINSDYSLKRDSVKNRIDFMNKKENIASNNGDSHENENQSVISHVQESCVLSSPCKGRTSYTTAVRKMNKPKTFVLPIMKTNPLNSPTKINVVIYKQRSETKSSEMTRNGIHSHRVANRCNIWEDVGSNNSGLITDEENTKLLMVKNIEYVEPEVKRCLDAMVEEISAFPEDIAQNETKPSFGIDSDEICNILCSVDMTTSDLHDNKQVVHVLKKSEANAECVTNASECCKEQNDISVSQEKSDVVSSPDDIKPSSLPKVICNLFKKDNQQKTDLNSKTNDSLNFNFMPFSKYLYDEGIVEDISDSKSANDIWGKHLLEKTSAKRVPKVMVQYMEHVEPSLLSDKLSYVMVDEFNRRGVPSSPDFLMHKISLCEEEIVLSDSGLDDSDEMLPSLEKDTIVQTIQC
ncbi:uncharacterized protein LOC126825501 [Patella vulgata]|uniref:uncharacterized protein LOC126825501 n=1 Tax=Patella vulgata TaxID=6465 RepID=UPI00217FFE6C|nr:uncharacterized protein LOC126825501 [Patella vulgata]XP_050411089.1 uncharacterized protein LOC126825501 [Patella vulgata]